MALSVTIRSMKFAVILDNVRSVHNVGSIFRAADAAGVEKIFCCGITPGPLDRFKHIRADFAKVSLGAEKSVAWESAKDAVSVIERLRSDGWKIFAIEQAERSIPYYEAAAFISGGERGIALVVGTEVGDLTVAVLGAADKILEIPMRGEKESLNVAVAFGIAIFALASPRPDKKKMLQS